MEDKIVIAYVCDKYYIPYLKKSIESIKRYNKNVEIAILSKDNFEIENAKVYTFKPDNSNFKFKLNDRMKDGVYYKFWLPLLPYKKIIYIDCDVICQRPLNSLWNIPIDFIGCTQSHNFGYKQAKELGFEKYFITGMMVMNLEQLRKENFTEQCLDLLSTLSEVKQHDETIINLLFNNRITEIDRKYNYCYNRKYDRPIPESDAYLLHYVGFEKSKMLENTNFEDLKPLKELLKDKSVAIVGNSQSIFSKRSGEEIDNHNIVIRFNRGFVKDKNCQGSKTDLLFLACTLTPQEINQFNCKYTIRRSIFSNSRCDFDLKGTDRNQFAQVANKQSVINGCKNSKASTGFLAIQFCLSTNCKSIDLYGFDFFKSPTYYNPTGYKTMHNGDKESEKVLEYQECNLLKIH